jgi:2-dehydro-3-deoxyphosphooctonate aldolase (KDO 8-P synthase)
METHPLARWRKAHKRTLNQLAEAAGCATSHLSQIESGKTNPSLKLIAKLQTITKGAIDASHFMPSESAPAARAHMSVGKVKFGNDLPLSIIAGPCQMESREHALEVSTALAKLAKKLKIGLIYKTSFDKANRTSAKAQRGIGIEKAIPIFKEITARTRLPTLTDVHEAEQCVRLADVVDVLQIPAFLCRQTDLLLAAAKTGCVVNVKKGQFLAPWDMKNVVEKLTGAGNRNVLVTERGASFGYNTLVSDMRSLPILARTTGAPVIFDATHSVQQPGGKGTSSGGEREFVPVLARAAVAVGVAGVFIETHPDPDNAPSDGPNMVPLKDMEKLLVELMAFDKIAKARKVQRAR